MIYNASPYKVRYDPVTEARGHRRLSGHDHAMKTRLFDVPYCAMSLHRRARSDYQHVTVLYEWRLPQREDAFPFRNYVGVRLCICKPDLGHFLQGEPVQFRNDSPSEAICALTPMVTDDRAVAGHHG